MDHLFAFKNADFASNEFWGLCKIRENNVNHITYMTGETATRSKTLWHSFEYYFPWKRINVNDLPQEVREYYRQWSNSRDIYNKGAYWYEAKVPEGYEQIIRNLIYFEQDTRRQFKLIYASIALSTLLLAALIIILHFYF